MGVLRCVRVCVWVGGGAHQARPTCMCGPRLPPAHPHSPTHSPLHTPTHPHPNPPTPQPTHTHPTRESLAATGAACRTRERNRIRSPISTGRRNWISSTDTGARMGVGWWGRAWGWGGGVWWLSAWGGWAGGCSTHGERGGRAATPSPPPPAAPFAHTTPSPTHPHPSPLPTHPPPSPPPTHPPTHPRGGGCQQTCRQWSGRAPGLVA